MILENSAFAWIQSEYCRIVIVVIWWLLFACNMHSCSVPGCSAGAQLLRFPREKEKYIEWISAIKNPMLRNLRYGEVYKNKRVCMDHFEEHCFKEESTIVNKLLLPDAVPTLNLPGQPSRIKCLAHLNSMPSHNYRATSVLNKSFYKLLKEQVLNLIFADRFCVLMFATIPLKPHLKYSNQHDKILGWQNCPGTSPNLYADHALVFMVQGLYSNWNQTISFVFCDKETSSDVLIQSLKHVLYTLFSLWFKVVATVCEPTDANVKAMCQLKLDAHAQCLHTVNELGYDSFVFDTREIIILYDTPSLLKNIRNDLLTNTFSFVIDNDNYAATWNDLTTYFRNKPEELTNYCLTRNDLNADRVKKNSLHCCTKIFSYELASAILKTESNDNLGLEGTGRFLLFFNELFDSLTGDGHKPPINKPLNCIVTPSSNHLDSWNQNIDILNTIKVIDIDGHERQPSCVAQWITTLHGIMHLWRNVLQRAKIKSFTPKFMQIQLLTKFLAKLRNENELFMRKTEKLTCYDFVRNFEDLIENMPETQIPLCDATRPLLFSMCQLIFNKKIANEDYKNLDLELNMKPRTLLPAPYFDGVKYESVLYCNNNSIPEFKSIKTFPIASTNKYIAKKIFNTLICASCLTCENTFFNHHRGERSWSTLRLFDTNFTRAFNMVASHVNQLLPNTYNKPDILVQLKASVVEHVDISFINNSCHIWDRLFVSVCVRHMVLVWVWQLNRYLSGQETVMYMNMNEFSRQAILTGMKQKNAMIKNRSGGNTYVATSKIKRFATEMKM